MIYKGQSIYYERLITLLYNLLAFILLIFIATLAYFQFNIILIIVIFLSFMLFLLFTIQTISIIKNTTNYFIEFYSDYMIILNRNYKIEVKYENIENMNLKGNYFYISPAKTKYLEIECGLKNPLYVRIDSKKSRDCLSVISNKNFSFCYGNAINNINLIEKRYKNLKLL